MSYEDVEEIEYWWDDRVEGIYWDVLEEDAVGCWVWTGVPKSTRANPAFKYFRPLHPASQRGAKQFVNECGNYACVRPKHWRARGERFNLTVWEEVPEPPTP